MTKVSLFLKYSDPFKLRAGPGGLQLSTSPWIMKGLMFDQPQTHLTLPHEKTWVWHGIAVLRYYSTYSPENQHGT